MPKLALAIVAMLVPLAARAGGRYRRDARGPAPALSERVKPRHAPATLARPAVTADDVLRGELVVEPVRAEQAAILEKLVRDTPDDDPQKPELAFRLAELYAAAARAWHLEAIARSLQATP
ncbi:MAG TPA: hypothetical protein VGL61_13475 [Kofleriaceae bacterium]|jgi:hypothetical protein